ncbi:MAG: glucose-6-phosphate isomerase [Candidatus Omnitrophica bacterium]|nr:glucose-6-phosphate isomerase [Candidatus Omnitrophota bacterium]
MRKIRFDFNNMFGFSVGSTHGVADADIRSLKNGIARAHSHLRRVLAGKTNRVNLGLEWAMLPYQDPRTIQAIQRLGNEIAAKFDNVISLGIGGSYLGLKAAQDALAPAYYNEFPSGRKGRPRIYFEGNNLDPETLSVLLKNLDPKKTFVVVISKSGETTETKAAFLLVQRWLKRRVGARYGRQVVAVTDPSSGTLRSIVKAESAADPKSFRSLPLLKGVGGRYSEFNMGLLHLAVIGIDINEVLAGARSMARRCSSPGLFKNPAYLYAALAVIQYRRKRKPITILMPFSEGLKSTADWYCQLLAESTGKKFARKVVIKPSGLEQWVPDKSSVKNVGRTPIATRGTNDLHSVQQNNIEGENDKVVTFIRVEKFSHDLRIPRNAGFLSGKYYGRLLSLAQEATEWALVREKRPNCAIIMPEVSAFHWGELIYFFEMATACEGELLGINAFDQPGVEGYKNYMYYKLRKPGLPPDVAALIRQHPLRKKPSLVI